MDFMGSIGLIAVVLAINFVVNSVVMYVVVNHIASSGERERFTRCMMAVFFMMVATLLSFLCLLIPIPLLNIVAFLFMLFWANKTAIEMAFERMEGGWTILFFYLACVFLLNYGLKAIAG